MLQIWLPLNKEGNFYNQGLADVTFTRNSGTYNSNGKLGGCYEFSGQSGTGISASDNGFMNKYINNHSWSICVWIKSTNANTPIMSLSYGLRLFSGSNASINLYNSTRSVYCHSGKATNDGNWHHIVATYDVTTNKITMYVDGSYSNSVNYSSGDTYSSSWSNGLFIGKDPNNNTIDCFYQGSLSDVRIYDHCLSPYEVHEIAKGLVLHYPLNDQYVQSTVYDCSGYCNNGTVTGSLQVVDDSPRYKKSIYSDGNQRITAPIGLDIPSNNLTVSCWVKRPEVIDSYTMRCILNPGYTNNNRFYFRILPQGNTAIFNVGFGENTYGTKTIDANWHHLAVTTESDGKTINIYVDGIKTNTGTEQNTFTIAGNFTLLNYFIGKISDFRFYRTTLSEDDIKELYNTSAIINNNNNLETYEFSEANTYSINKSGVLEGAEFIEQDGDVQINNTEQVFATEFTEI